MKTCSWPLASIWDRKWSHARSQHQTPKLQMHFGAFQPMGKNTTDLKNAVPVLMIESPGKAKKAEGIRKLLPHCESGTSADSVRTRRRIGDCHDIKSGHQTHNSPISCWTVWRPALSAASVNCRNNGSSHSYNQNGSLFALARVVERYRKPSNIGTGVTTRRESLPVTSQTRTDCKMHDTMGFQVYWPPMANIMHLMQSTHYFFHLQVRCALWQRVKQRV